MQDKYIESDTHSIMRGWSVKVLFSVSHPDVSAQNESIDYEKLQEYYLSV